MQAGTPLRDEVYVHIVWPWLAFLGVQILLAYLFLVVTIRHSLKRGIPGVKDSGLAILLASTDEVRAAIGKVNSFKEAEEKAMHIKVKLVDGRFVLVN